MNFFPKKSLGQHFLFNPVTIDQILCKADLQETDCVLEIGPGPGAMTERIASRVQKLVVVEKDRRFVEDLKEKFSTKTHLVIIEGDFLNLVLEKILDTEKKWKVIANLPYNIATEIIFRLLESRHLFHSFYLMVQREVAERLVAKPGSKDYSALSVMSQVFSENKIVMRLPPGAFSPPPKVHSAIVAFQVSESPRFPIRDLELFRSTVRAAFGQRRKMIRNSLRERLGFSMEAIDRALKQAEILPTQRPETLSMETFARLANTLLDRSGDLV